MSRWIRVVVLGVVLGLGVNWFLRTRLFAPRPPDSATLGVTVEGAAPQDVATDLVIPWEVEFLSDGGFLITERPGTLTRLAADGSRRWTTPVTGVRHRGEGGLLGLALDPTFAESGWIYLYLTSDDANRIERWTLSGDGSLSEARVLVDGIPAAGFHDGGRLHFGPDGMLYATTGDAGDRASARDLASLGGKILRMTPEGSAPETNPSGSRIWSIGHRNPQGLAWDDAGRLWSTEHGRSGVRSGLDELNLVEGGGDYGWPEFQGSDAAGGIVPPVLQSGPNHTWAPSGAAWLDGRLYFGGLRGEALYEVSDLDGDPELVVHFFGDLGRIRQVRVGPDGMLYLLTGNRDGRGRPRAGDDRLVRVDPEALRRN